MLEKVQSFSLPSIKKKLINSLCAFTFKISLLELIINSKSKKLFKLDSCTVFNTL